MASKLYIMPGLKVPDNNFNWPIGSTYDCAWQPTYIASGEYYYVGTRPQGCYDSAYTYGTGRSLSMNLASMPANATWTDYIESSYTPYSVAAGPASSLRVRLWVGVIAATAGMSASNAADVLRVSVIARDADGEVKNTLSKTLLTTRSENSFALYQGVIEETSISADTRHYTVRLAFCQPTTGEGRVIVDWIGVGLCSDDDDTGPQLSSWYGAQGSHSSETDRKWISGRHAEHPHILVGGRAAHMQTISFQFPYIQTVDKRLIQSCWLWNSGTPSDDFAGSLGYTDAVDRGTSQPVLIAPDRADMKRAMYCDMSAPPPWLQSTSGMWPDSNAIWSASLTFRERP